MDETQKQTFELEFIQDFGSISFTAKVEADTLDEAINMVREDPFAFMGKGTLRTVQGAVDAGLELDGVVFWQDLTEEEDDD